MGLRGQRHAPDILPQGNKPCTHFTRNWVGPTCGLDGWGNFRPFLGTFEMCSFFQLNHTQRLFTCYTSFNFATGQHDIIENIISVLPLNPKFLYFEKENSKFCNNKVSPEGTVRRGILYWYYCRLSIFSVLIIRSSGFLCRRCVATGCNSSPPLPFTVMKESKTVCQLPR